MAQKKQIKNNPRDSAIADEAMVIAQGIKQENQTKTQTRLIAQGIRKGIELYKNQQNKKQRELDKRKKKESKNKLNMAESQKNSIVQESKKTFPVKIWLPWSLLLLSWLLFVVYFIIV